MNTNRREKRRTSTLDDIKAAAWKQVAEQGASGLSLRAIAREIDMTAPALYRYYKDRDALVTALMIEAFNSFSEMIEAARDACHPSDHRVRFQAICKAYFQWAMGDPQKYLLLFGTPIPGYQFSDELAPAAQRSFLILQSVIADAYAAGSITGELAALRLPAPLKSQYEMLIKMGMPSTPLVTHLALALWSMMHGMTSLFIYGYFSGFLGAQAEAFVDVEIEKMIRMLGLQ